jgi:copper homeostasis protein CutC
MITEDKIIDMMVATEDVLAHLEQAIAQAEGAIIKMPAAKIHAESPKLFDISLALVRASKEASAIRANLLTTLKMPAETRFYHAPRQS